MGVFCGSSIFSTQTRPGHPLMHTHMNHLVSKTSVVGQKMSKGQTIPPRQRFEDGRCMGSKDGDVDPFPSES